jgi:plastocyanin
MRRAPLLLVTVAAVVALPAPAAVARTVDVSIEDIDYSERSVSIKRGDRVRWTWRDGRTPHDVKSTGSPRFRSSALKETGTHVVRFTRRGTYRYVCSIHLNMRGRVVVR